MNPTAQVNKNSSALSHKVATILADRSGNPHQISADATGTLPTRFELLKVGYWHTQDHGDIMISPSDLQEYYEHYLAGYGRSGGEKKSQLPINFGHKSKDKAAGWFDIAVEGDTLWAVNVIWSKSGKEGILGGEWKFISAEFYPVGRGGWPDPLDWDHFVENVIDGAALTNIPLFSQLNPVMASAKAGDGHDKIDVFVITASQDKERSMDLATIRAKKTEELTEEEKTFVAQNKDQLTAEEQTKFGLEVKKEETPAAPEGGDDKTKTPQEGEKVAVTEEQEAAVAASLKKKGFVMVEADRMKSLEETADRYEKDQATAIVKAHIGRGAIVADQEDRWVSRLMASRGSARADLESDLKALPSNEVFASMQGAGDDEAGDATSVADELKSSTLKVQADAKAAGTELTYGQAQAKLLRENDALRVRVEAAQK